MQSALQLPRNYQELLHELKGRIRNAQIRAAFAVNQEMILLYWSIGREISGRFGREEWGGKIVDRLSRDLQSEFSGVEGFSARSLRYILPLPRLGPTSQFCSSLLQHCRGVIVWCCSTGSRTRACASSTYAPRLTTAGAAMCWSTSTPASCTRGKARP